MTCADKLSKFVFYLGMFIIFSPVDQTKCNHAIDHWCLVMWLLLLSRFISFFQNRENYMVLLILGNSLSSPIIFYWIIKGIVFLSTAKGDGCYTQNSFFSMLVLVISASMSIMLFILIVLVSLLFILNRILFHVLSLIVGRERIQNLAIFRFNLVRFIQRDQPPTLDEVQISSLKEKAEKTITAEDLTTDKFKENPCPICLDLLELDQKYIMLSCGHFFHTDCLGTWVSKKSTCPMCNKEIKLEDFDQPAETELNPVEASNNSTGVTDSEDDSGELKCDQKEPDSQRINPKDDFEEPELKKTFSEPPPFGNKPEVEIGLSQFADNSQAMLIEEKFDPHDTL